MSSAPSSSPTPPNQQDCASCGNRGKVQHCARCRSVAYCSKGCQKANWKEHKKICGRPATTLQEEQSTNSQSQRAQKTCIASAIDVDGKPHKAVADQLFSNIPKDELYKRLIDLFRLRAEDSFIYSGPQPFWILEYRWRDQDFEEYLEKCSAKELLPSWFDKASKAECRTLAMDSHQEWFIGHAIDEEDIEQRYGISYVKPLRSLAAHIFDHAFEYSKDPDDIGVLLAWREKEYAQGGFHRLPRKPGQERLSRYDLRPRHGHDRIERSHRLLDDYKQVQKEMSFDEYCTIMEGAGLGYGMGCICDHPDFKGRGFSRIE